MYLKDDLKQEFNVSCETIDKLEIYVNLILKWQNKINLISNNTKDDIWERHIKDSYQVFKYLKNYNNVFDIGSGGGLPVIVCGILNNEIADKINFFAADSDKRKCVFLKNVINELNLNIKVINDRVENIKINDIDLITSRGFSSVENTLKLTESLCCNNYLLLKGENYLNEISGIKDISYNTYQSLTNKNSIILELNKL